MQNEFIPKTTPMKTVQFETTKVHGIFVKIDDFKEMKRVGMNLGGNFRIQYETVNGTTNTFTVVWLDENYKFIGLLTNLTDSQKEAVCKDADEFASLLESLGIDDLDNWILLTANK